jgi:hypothetical protein
MKYLKGTLWTNGKFILGKYKSVEKKDEEGRKEGAREGRGMGRQRERGRERREKREREREKREIYSLFPDSGLHM